MNKDINTVTSQSVMQLTKLCSGNDGINKTPALISTFNFQSVNEANQKPPTNIGIICEKTSFFLLMSLFIAPACQQYV